MNKYGFTLIEVLIAVAIFSFIALGTGTAIQRGITVKKVVEQEWAYAQGVRSAFMILERDLSLAFHKPSASPSFGFNTSDRDRWFKTFFKGKDKELHFTSLANRSIYANTHESELCEIGYQLTDDAKELRLKNISRRLAIYIDDDPEKGGKTRVLLENIKDISFRYFSKEKDRWSDQWDSEHSDYKNKFPDAVEIKISLPKKEGESQVTLKVLLPQYSIPKSGNPTENSGGNTPPNSENPDQKPNKPQGDDADSNPF